ncbi:MAG: hypothetical protein COU32_01985 [Candidatus Magasanikbacteria bacterium CG10_big_fil_rev_8_21_14_0_10_42_10]|uniref:Uncharacterized protein n=2 Tax=Candidatus Magasanikiibacteriota TaxID=1752731 RepID=A0A2H0TWA1_9BACT|nr:MAG: hypothetical protein COU32_01985 [Candidatus Magasanikbacteria bacterium CG10_big_fil_rev_8_21_14_0_10_42_10]PIZ93323.1 MAG: hypothetical protein COX82_02760 [Candidatus Magasanikbacteria bacterium CG_4_10_14_0_2_um_filter_41_10]
MATVPVKQSDGTIVYMTLEEIEAASDTTGQEPQSEEVEEHTPKEMPKNVSVDTPETEKKELPMAEKTALQEISQPTQQKQGTEKKIENVPTQSAVSPSLSVDASLPKNIVQKNEPEKKQQKPPVTKTNEESVPLPKKLVEASSHDLSTSTPVGDYFVDIARAHEWDERDHVSPLEERVGETDGRHHTGNPLPASRYEDTKAVLQMLSFSIPQDLRSRLHSLIQSRMKDVRSDQQLIDYAMRSSDQGGLSLSHSQAETLVEAIHSTLALRKEEHIPSPRKTVMTAPVPKNRARGPSTPVVVSDESPLSERGEKQTSFTDIHPPEKIQQTVGPLEEMAQFTLTDLRRYNQDPVKAMALLQDKVHLIREESYLEYQKIKIAWQQSPLYQQYLSQIAQALRERVPLVQLASQELTPEDMNVIAGFSAMLRM